MATGVKVWDGSGNLTFDGTTRISRVLGTIAVPAGATGSVTDAGFATGAPYCIALRINAGAPNQPNNSMAAPIISFAGTTMSYNVAAPSGDHMLIYGVY
jgi:hypothetical protein